MRRVCKWCQRPSRLLDYDKRRSYCRGQCFDDARKAYFLRLDATPERQAMHRRTALAYKRRRHQGHQVEPRDRHEYRTREEVRQRHKVLVHAWAEARERGIDVREVLAEWKASVGQAGKMERARAER